MSRNQWEAHLCAPGPVLASASGFGPQGWCWALWLELQTSGPAPASQAVASGPRLVLASCVVASGLGPGLVPASLAGPGL